MALNPGLVLPEVRNALVKVTNTHSCLADDERGPLALQEILLAGCPTVGVRTGAPYVEHGFSGFWVERLPSWEGAMLTGSARAHFVEFVTVLKGMPFEAKVVLSSSPVDENLATAVGAEREPVSGALESGEYVLILQSRQIANSFQSTNLFGFEINSKPAFNCFVVRDGNRHAAWPVGSKEATFIERLLASGNAQTGAMENSLPDLSKLEIWLTENKNLEFPLACFLIGAEKHCYFCYSWGWLPEHGALDTFPELEKPLGPPKGPAVQEGWKFRREFEYASVFVDIEQRVGKITWH